MSSISQLQAQKLRLAYTRSSHYGGSLPNVNQIGCGLAEFQVSGHQPAGSAGSQAASPVDSPVSFGRAPSTHLWIHLGALGTTGWWNGCSEILEEWCPRSAAIPATYPSRGFGESGGWWDGVPPELMVGRDFKCCPVPSSSRSSPLPGLPEK